MAHSLSRIYLMKTCASDLYSLVSCHGSYNYKIVPHVAPLTIEATLLILEKNNSGNYNRRATATRNIFILLR